jgi:exopolyphosphatase/guanosine-5'-triphosphate,3'-diphosphate pyrophosphatase
VTQQRLAAIDIGSTTIHLVVADTDGQTLIPIADELDITRIGSDVGQTGMIAAAKFDEAAHVVAGYVAHARQLSAAQTLLIATEAVRVARNACAFAGHVAHVAGQSIVVLSGEEEAALTFWGATAGHDLSRPLVIADLGGGSLEVILNTGNQIAWRRSLPLGAGSLRDRFLPTDPPAEADIQQLRAYLHKAFAALPHPDSPRDTIAVGGTATTLQDLANRVLKGTPAATLTQELLRQSALLLAGRPSAIVERDFGIAPARAQLLPAGVEVLQALLRWLDTEQLEVSTRGVREGAILAYARYGPNWQHAARVAGE